MKIIISDSNREEVAITVDQAVLAIDCWWDNSLFDNVVREAASEAAYTMEPPKLEDLQKYADTLCEKIRYARIEQAFHGRGRWKAPYASPALFDLRIDIIYDLKHPVTRKVRSRDEWEQIYWMSTDEEWGGANFEDTHFEEVR